MKTINLKKIKLIMKYLSKSLIITAILTVFLSKANCYSQSEDEKISSLIEQKKSFNKNNKNSIVYKIQLYNGDEDEAYKMQRDFEATFPEYLVKVVYNKPEFKTQVGQFKTRLEADKILLIIKEEYNGAIVLEDKI
jgi:hypothetical protein